MVLDLQLQFGGHQIFWATGYGRASLRAVPGIGERGDGSADEPVYLEPEQHGVPRQAVDDVQLDKPQAVIGARVALGMACQGLLGETLEEYPLLPDVFFSDVPEVDAIRRADYQGVVPYSDRACLVYGRTGPVIIPLPFPSFSQFSCLAPILFMLAYLNRHSPAL